MAASASSQKPSFSLNSAWRSPAESRVARIAGASSVACTALMPRDRYSPSNSRVESSGVRSEEHTSELQSRLHLVCRLLLEKKKKTTYETFSGAGQNSL